MTQPPIPRMPSPQPPSRKSNGPVYAVLAILLVGGLAFMYLLFQEKAIIAFVVFAVIGLVGWLHYITWGRSMTEDAKKEAKAMEERQSS